MNIRTATDIDHAIQAACDLHDLRAGQTGTIRTPRVPAYDAPADQPPVEFDGEEDDRGVLTLAADYWRLRAEWLPLNARWEPMHAVALSAAEAVIKVLGHAGTSKRQWSLVGAISDATGATATGAEADAAEARVDAVLGRLIDRPATSLPELAAKIRIALFDLHGIEDASAVDIDEADWPVHVWARICQDVERLAATA
jgi:hypothetical protein